MNPVENPLTQMMQAFGAAPSDSADALLGLQSTTSENDALWAAQFSGYMEGVDPTANGVPTTAFADLAKNRALLVHTVPTDAAFAVDPAAAVAQSDVVVQTLPANSNALQTLLADGAANGGRITPETAEAFSLAVNYHSATPAALSSVDLVALQSAAPANFAWLSASQPIGDIAGASGASGALSLGPVVTAQSPVAPGQFLPASDLKFLFSETPTLPASATGDSQALITNPVFGVNAPTSPGLLADTHNSPLAAGPSSTPLVDIITPASTVHAPALTAADAGTAPQAANVPTAADQLNALGNKSPAFEGGSEASRTNGAVTNFPAHALQQNIDPEMDADGQVLAVNQKAQSTNNGLGAATTQTPAKASQIAAEHSQAQASTPGQAVAAAAQAASSEPMSAPKRSDSKTTAESLTGDAPKTDAPKINAPTTLVNQPVIAEATRGSLNWTSPWITPERAAGWPDGFAASLVSTGLGGLMGNQSSLSGMGMFGGQPNATMSGQVTKQLNLNMTRAVKAGEQEFSMRMDPPELGRVSVKLRFGQNGLVKSQIMAERPETLELLQREIRGLERAVEAGGHKSEQGGISFSLDSGGQESAGKAFAEAMQQDRLKAEIEGRSGEQSDSDFTDGDSGEIDIDLDEILARVTPETGLDVRV